VTDGWGAGGPTRSVVVRAEPIELGDARICGALAGLSVATRGTFSDANFDGNIGSGLLKRFRVTFDYRRQTMYLSPYSRLEPDTGKADRSGMWLNLAAKGLSVMDVMAGGPAAKAGLQVGDMLTRVDGEPVRTRSLSDWRIYFKIVENGRSISIHYVRGDGHQAAILSPAAIIPDPRC
jgi:membrane-associated protease RseP (regulator of RpoE activity)